MPLRDDDLYWLRKGLNSSQVAMLLGAVGDRVLDRRCRDRCIHFLDAGASPLLCPHYRVHAKRPLDCAGYERDVFDEYSELLLERIDLMQSYKDGLVTDEEFRERAEPIRRRMRELSPLLW